MMILMTRVVILESAAPPLQGEYTPHNPQPNQTTQGHGENQVAQAFITLLSWGSGGVEASAEMRVHSARKGCFSEDSAPLKGGVVLSDPDTLECAARLIFWQAIAVGRSSEEAAVDAGASAPLGPR